LKKFKFKFQSLLNFRRHRRDLCRLYLAQVLAKDRKLIGQRHSLKRERLEQLHELREIGRAGNMDIDRSASRRYFAGQLTGEMHLVDRNRELVAQQLKLCQQALSKADQDVKVLEKLEEKQRAEFLYHRERRDGHELDEIWMAGHLREFTK